MNFSFKRDIRDYYKVQRAISRFIRGKAFFFNRRKIDVAKYLDIGPGPNHHEEFVNLDYLWRKGIDVCWDLCSNKLPFIHGKFRGVFSEHCFEHIPFESFKMQMAEIYRVLENGGTLRLIMPDGEIYFDAYAKNKLDKGCLLPFQEGYISAMHRVNGIFRNHGHQFIYDYETVEIILKECGFQDVTKARYLEGSNPDLLKDTDWREVESLYVEARK